jgi:hypothetical protein
MTEAKALAPREIKERRERAIDQMEHAAWAAGISASIALVLLLTLAIETGAWAEVAPYLTSVGATYFLAYAVYQRRQWPAVVMLLNWVGGVVARWVQQGYPSNIFLTALFGYFIVRGVMGALRYAELKELYPEYFRPAT